MATHENGDTATEPFDADRRDRPRLPTAANEVAAASKPTREPPAPDKADDAPERADRRVPDDEKAKGLPQTLRDRYLQVGDRYFRDASSKDAAFEDHGTRLTGADPGVARDLVAIARHRGWEDIHVRGSEEFRREVWKEATALGIGVTGYKPSDLERAEARRHGEGTVSRADRGGMAPAHNDIPSRSSARPDFNTGISGRVADIGAEKYDERAKTKTPYLDIETDDGRRHRAWGVALDEAVKEAGIQIGDKATVRRSGRDPVEVTTDDGRIPAERNRWTVTVERDVQRPSSREGDTRAQPEARHQLAERFLRQDHAENARDPQLRAAQSHVMLAQTAARERYGSDDKAIDGVVRAAKVEIATRLSQGQQVEAVQIKDRGRVQAEQTRELLLRSTRDRSR